MHKLNRLTLSWAIVIESIYSQKNFVSLSLRPHKHSAPMRPPAIIGKLKNQNAEIHPSDI